VSASWPWENDVVASPFNGTLNLNVGLIPIPEPRTLGLLGTGLFDLVGMMRRKRNLGT